MARTVRWPSRKAGVEARLMKPTQRHRLAVWECMLGTVYAFDGTKTRYFDYDHAAALAYAGVTQDSDPRLAVKPGRYRYTNDSVTEPGPKQKALWILKEAA